jgi:hypothetical protein
VLDRHRGDAAVFALALPGIDAATGLPNAWRHGVDAARIEERQRDGAPKRDRCDPGANGTIVA